VTLISLGGPGIVGLPDVGGAPFSTTADVRANVLLISQSSSQNDIVHRLLRGRATHRGSAAQGVLQTWLIKRGTHQRGPTIASLPLSAKTCAGIPGIAGKTFSLLGNQNVNIIAIAQGSSESTFLRD